MTVTPELDWLFALLPWAKFIAVGGLGTLSLAATALPFGLAGGLLLALAKDADEPSWRLVGNAITTLLRGTPELVTLILVFIVGQSLLRQLHEVTGLGRADVSAFAAGVVALSMIFAAYASEVFVGALRSLDSHLIDAARALGLGRSLTWRFIGLPELLRLSLPGLSNLWLSLLKQTALVSTLSYPELVHQAAIGGAGSGHRLVFLVVVFIIFLTLADLSRRILGRVQVGLDKGRRA